MTHLPECYKENSTDACICPELRACEQRVIAEGDYQSQIAYDCGYATAIDQAEAAVAGSTYHIHKEGGFVWLRLTDALSAIRALRKEQS